MVVVDALEVDPLVTVIEYGGSSSRKEQPNTNEHKNSTILTSVIIIADVIAAGVLSMPVAMAYFGWLLGSILLLVLALVNVHIVMIMWHVVMHSPGVRTYAELARASCAGLSERHQNWAICSVGVCQMISLCATLTIYTLTLGEGLGMLFNETHICLPYWTLIGIAIIFPFAATARTLGSWPSLLFLNIATILGSVLIPLISWVSLGLDATRIPGSQYEAVETLTLSHCIAGFGTILFSLTSQGIIVEIIAEMESPAEFPKALLGAMLFIVFVYFLIGLGGYYYRGDLIEGIIGANIPFGAWYSVMALCLLLHMLIVWISRGVVAGRVIYQCMGWGDARDVLGKNSWYLWILLVGTMLLMCWLVANVIPFFNDFVSLIGSIVTPFMAIIFPSLLYARWMWDFSEKSNSISVVGWCVIMIELVSGVVVFSVGTATNIETLYNNWETYGWPFECHCQHMWSTCACSADNIAMTHCDAA